MGRIFAIKKFEIHDGNGIRTTLFLKGCPLRCKWCHNPEGQLFKPQTGYIAAKCTNCGECAAICETRAHSIAGGKHVFRRELCNGCGKCAEICTGDALEFYGQEVSAGDVVKKLLEDREYYALSGGGVTVSGGEPLQQPDFLSEILSQLKKEGINTAVDTSGYASGDAIGQVIKLADMFLFDVKAIDDTTHTTCTGVSNRIILDNLYRIDKAGVPIEIRIPLVPGYNDREIEPIGRFLKGLDMVKAVRILPYHDFAEGKYRALEMTYEMGNIKQPTREMIEKAVAQLKNCGLNAVCGDDI